MSHSLLQRILRILKRSSTLFEGIHSESEVDIKELRLDLARLEGEFEKVLPRKLLKSGQCLDHLNSSEFLRLKKFNELLPNGWLENCH